MDRVIVTGATGFIGSWLVNELLENGIEVTAIIRNKSKINPDLLNKNKFRYAELLQGATPDAFELDISGIDKNGYDAFFHLAWDGVSGGKKNEITLQINNIMQSVKALELSKRLQCKKFIAAGTVAEYAFSNQVLDFEKRQTPNDMYGAAKAASHFFLEVRAKQLEQPFIWAVIPSTYGERRSDENIITYTIKSLLRKEIPHYGQLNQMWDFLYAGETARALRLIAEKGQSGKSYGIGSGIYKPLKEYIKTIRNFINPEMNLGIGDIPELSEKTFSSCVNIEQLTNDTGFIPEVSFEQGIQKTIEYYRKEMATKHA